jgi:hypothetical protein
LSVSTTLGPFPAPPLFMPFAAPGAAAAPPSLVRVGGVEVGNIEGYRFWPCSVPVNASERMLRGLLHGCA